MISQRYTLRNALLMGVFSLPLVVGCNQEGIQNPGGGVGGNSTVPERGRGTTPSPSTPGPGDMRTSTGTGTVDSGSDATTRSATSDIRPGTGSSMGTGTSPSERNGSASTPSPRSESVNPSGNADKAVGANHVETRPGSAGNSGTTSGLGTGDNSSGGTASKGLGPQ